ncbi:DUF4399 domain-containing protein [Duganella sp. S19_KUP01_CR8]|uniref:DUF4399 domain-containing protein n=1 Tax=Duganella sp. S19_KUP01_CR8 TaxID=3025502 RepID=UPI002FCDB465
MMKSIAAAAAFLALSTSAFAQQSVSFVEPADGATVTSPVKVKFAVSGMEVKPAGDMTANTGHHHLLINAAPVKAGEVVPADETHIHFGKGQTETEVKLAPGTYVLSMQFANGLHQSYGPGMSKDIKITVK